MEKQIPTVLLIGGKLAAEKNTCAEKLCRNAVLLSCNEQMPSPGETDVRVRCDL